MFLLTFSTVIPWYGTPLWRSNQHVYLSNTINQVLRHTNRSLSSLTKCTAVNHLIISNHPCVSSQCSVTGFRLDYTFLGWTFALEEASLEPLQQGLNSNQGFQKSTGPSLAVWFQHKNVCDHFFSSSCCNTLYSQRSQENRKKKIFPVKSLKYK